MSWLNILYKIRPVTLRPKREGTTLAQTFWVFVSSKYYHIYDQIYINNVRKSQLGSHHLPFLHLYFEPFTFLRRNQTAMLLLFPQQIKCGRAKKEEKQDRREKKKTSGTSGNKKSCPGLSHNSALLLDSVPNSQVFCNFHSSRADLHFFLIPPRTLHFLFISRHFSPVLI